MLKEILKQKGDSIYKVSKEADIPYSTINDLINEKTEIEN